MCGIAGFHLERPDLLGPSDREPTLRRMSESLVHRGPDDRGIEDSGPVGLAFARLSIIDLPGGHQPMTSPDGRYAVVFNGEIYNYRELRTALAAGGRRFATESDTEVLLAMYEKHGPAMLEKLNGMFAFVIHDRKKQCLFGARDRLGIKPLYYAHGQGAFVFGSEIKAILAADLHRTEIDGIALSDYLSYGFVCSPRTIYQGIHSLLPGHCFRYQNGQVTTQRYWQVERRDGGPTRMEEAAEELEGLLRDSVRLRMIADVPLGALLSGGIDSGLVVSLMAQIADRPVKTFTVGFAEPRYNELPWARNVAEKYHTDHIEILCDPDIHALVEKIAVHWDQPFGDSSAVPTFLVCQEARRHVTVALAGDGGDEVFAGYRRHTQLAAPSSSASLVRPLARLATGLLPATTRGAQRLRRAGLRLQEQQADTIVLIEDRLKRWLAGPRLERPLRETSSVDLALRAGGPFEAERGLRRHQHQDLALYLPDDILTKVDCTSMMNSLEVRVPLLDHRVVEFGLNLPPALKNDGVQGKLVLRELGKKLLPEGHLQKRKSGFAIPAAKWLRDELSDLLQDALADSQLAAAGWLRQSALDQVIKEHQAGRSRASALWSLLMAEIWFRGRPRGPASDLVAVDKNRG